MSSEERRRFTTAEAEALLPEIDRLLEAAQKLLERYEELQRPAALSAQSNGHVRRDGDAPGEAAGEQRSIQAELERIVEQIQSQGVIVRDLRTGLIDFPALREGQTIFLCWKRGEPLRLEWWHPTSTGIAGRQRL